MTFAEAILLAVVQGLTEFLPVSSSGHLVMAQALLVESDAAANLLFAVILHLASAGAIATRYARDLVELVTRRRRELALLVVATIPAGLVGALAKDLLERLFAGPPIAAGGLLVTAAILFAAERWARQRRDFATLPFLGALAVGLAQAVAILPGISRSGSTIGAGLAAGLRRADAVRFAFLLGLPVILGAGVAELRDAVRGEVAVPWGPTLAAVAVCYAVSLGAIRLVEWLGAKRRLSWFALYCAVVGGAGLVYFGVLGRTAAS